MLISSTSNPQIKYIRNLCQKLKLRQAHREFCVEGVQAISEAYRHGWHVKQLIYCPTMVRSDWAKKTIAESHPWTHLQVTAELFEKLSYRSYSELMAIVPQAQDDPARIPIRADLLATVVDRPQNAGNLGTIIRSTDAMGGHGVLVMQPAADLYNPKTIRSTMGSLFAVPVLRIETHQIFQKWIDTVRTKLGDLQVVATSPHGLTRIDQHDFTLPTVLIIGTERSGIHKYFETTSDVLVSIPMSGSADSLNSSVSASIVLYEANRQRLARRTGAD